MLNYFDVYAQILDMFGGSSITDEICMRSKNIPTELVIPVLLAKSHRKKLIVQ